MTVASAVVIGASGCANSDAGGAPDAGVVADRCVAPAGITTAPGSVADVVTLLNALPAPVSLPCFLDTLARPLQLHATVSLISAQPSVGPRSPRIFLFFDGLRMAIVPAGVGSHLLELGEIRDPSHSLKAEIEFPVVATLSHADPFQRVLFSDTATRCSFCHLDEQPAGDIAFVPAFTSVALRPSPYDGVSVESLSAYAASCNSTAEPDRCAMLKALFDQGAPVEQAFPPELPTLQ